MSELEDTEEVEAERPAEDEKDDDFAPTSDDLSAAKEESDDASSGDPVKAEDEEDEESDFGDRDVEDEIKVAIKEANDLPDGFIEWEAVRWFM